MPSGVIWNEVLEVGTAEKSTWKQGRFKVHSDVIWIDVLELVTAEKSLKAKTPTGAL